MLPDGELVPELLEVDGMSLPPTNFANAEHTTGALAPVGLGQHPQGAARAGDALGRRRRLHRAQGRARRAHRRRRASVSPTRTSSTPRAGGSTSTRPWRDRLSRFALKGDGLGPRETVAEFEDGIFPDGFEFDAEGGIWIASVVSNRLLRIAPDGSQTVVLDDGDPEVDRARRTKLRRASAHARRHRRRSRRRFGQSRQRHLRRRRPQDGVSGLAVRDRIATFRSPIAGARRRTGTTERRGSRWLGASVGDRRISLGRW